MKYNDMWYDFDCKPLTENAKQKPVHTQLIFNDKRQQDNSNDADRARKHRRLSEQKKLVTYSP